jgi:hypothetical protein
MVCPGAIDAAQTEHAPEEPSDHPTPGSARKIRLRQVVNAHAVHGWSPSQGMTPRRCGYRNRFSDKFQ